MLFDKHPVGKRQQLVGILSHIERLSQPDLKRINSEGRILRKLNPFCEIFHKILNTISILLLYYYYNMVIIAENTYYNLLYEMFL